MQPSTRETVTKLLQLHSPRTVLDCPSGDGWLVRAIPDSVCDGIDLYKDHKSLYRNLIAADLENGIPSELPEYDLIACCEGIEHFGNPELFFRSCREHLKHEGLLLITTPNTWQPSSRLQFNLKGFFPGFPCLVGKIKKGNHMHIMPWNFPQLYLFLTLSGFKDIKLIDQPLSKPKHFYEKLLVLPQKLYCKNKLRKAMTQVEKDFWMQASKSASTLGRHLIVTAKKP